MAINIEEALVNLKEYFDEELPQIDFEYSLDDESGVAEACITLEGIDDDIDIAFCIQDFEDFASLSCMAQFDKIESTQSTLSLINKFNSQHDSLFNFCINDDGCLEASYFSLLPTEDLAGPMAFFIFASLCGLSDSDLFRTLGYLTQG